MTEKMDERIVGLAEEILEKCDLLLSMVPSEEDMSSAYPCRWRVEEARNQMLIVREAWQPSSCNRLWADGNWKVTRKSTKPESEEESSSGAEAPGDG